MDRVWDKDAFWDTPKKNVLNCISEQEEGNKNNLVLNVSGLQLVPEGDES